MSSTVEVRIIVRDANGEDSDVTVRDFIKLGDLIPEKINVVAAEAAALANEGLKLPSQQLRRDRTR